MRYIDPYEFFEIDIDSNEALSPSKLRRARQRKLAEFELSDDGFLYWEGEAVEKRLALDLAEALSDPTTSEYYRWIHEDKALKTFLKGDGATPLQAVYINGILRDESYRDFCSPFFAATFDRILRPALETRDWIDAKMILEHSNLISVDDLDQAYASAVRYMERSILALEKASRSDNPKSELSHIEFVTWDTFPGLANAFPDHFQALVNKLSRKVRDAANQFDKVAGNSPIAPDLIDIAWRLICAAVDIEAEINVSEDNVIYKNRIKRRYDLAKKAKEKVKTPPPAPKYSTQSSPKPHKETKSFALVGVVLVIILIIAVSLLRSLDGHKRSKSSVLDRISKIPQVEYKSQRKKMPITAHRDFGLTRTGARGIYYRLKKAYDDGTPEGDVVKQKKTGWQPYKAFYAKPKANASMSNKGFDFRNKTKKDLVLLIDRGFASELEASYYVRKGEKLSHKQLDDGLYFLYVYMGESWLDSIAEYEEQPLGGFAYPGKYIGSESYEKRAQAPYKVLSLLSIYDKRQNISFQADSFFVKE